MVGKGRMLGVLAAIACALAPTADAAEAQELLTLDVPSRHVDPAQVELSQLPEGVDPAVLHANVLLPDGYERRRAYPVLYLLHGHGSGFASWARPDLGDIENTAAGLDAIVVMPEGGNGWYTDWWNGGTRGQPAWERYILRDVIAKVSRRFRIREGRRWHAIAGQSMGGEGAMSLASQRPGYFGTAASFSGILSTQRPEWPTLFDTQGESHLDVFGDPEAQSYYWAGHNPQQLAGNLEDTRLYVAVGDGVPGALDEIKAGALSEFALRPHSQDFVAAARQAGADVTYAPHGGIHDWRYWRRDLANTIEWGLFEPVARISRSWTYRTVARRGRVWGARFSFEDPPDVLVTLSREGRVLRGEGAGQLALRIPHGCGFAVSVPFERRLTRRCASRLSHARDGLRR